VVLVVVVVVVAAAVWGQELPSALMLLVKLMVFILPIQSVTISATVMILIIMNGSFGRKIVVLNSADGLKNFD